MHQTFGHFWQYFAQKGPKLPFWLILGGRIFRPGAFLCQAKNQSRRLRHCAEGVRGSCHPPHAGTEGVVRPQPALCLTMEGLQKYLFKSLNPPFLI